MSRQNTSSADLYRSLWDEIDSQYERLFGPDAPSDNNDTPRQTQTLPVRIFTFNLEEAADWLASEETDSEDEALEEALLESLADNSTVRPGSEYALYLQALDENKRNTIAKQRKLNARNNWRRLRLLTLGHRTPLGNFTQRAWMDQRPPRAQVPTYLFIKQAYNY